MVGLSIILGILLGWHIYLTIHNMTTIEVGCEFPKLNISSMIFKFISEYLTMDLCQYYEGVRAMWLARKTGQSYQHPFDLGVYKNITLVSLSLSMSVGS